MSELEGGLREGVYGKLGFGLTVFVTWSSMGMAGAPAETRGFLECNALCVLSSTLCFSLFLCTVSCRLCRKWATAVGSYLTTKRKWEN